MNTSYEFPNWTYEYPFRFEPYNFEVIDTYKIRVWISGHRPTVIFIAFLYVLFVQFAPKLMKDRPAFDLRRALAVWNFALALFSVAAFYRTFPDFYDLWWGNPNGPYETVCVRFVQKSYGNYEFLLKSR